MKLSSRLFLLPLAFVIGGLLVAGCGSTAPTVGSISGPDTLETEESGTFEAVIDNEEEADAPLTYQWQFGDGSTGSGTLVSHAYNSTGEYDILFRASNDGGADSSRTSIVVVPPPEPASIVSVNARPNPVDEGNRVRFSSNVQGDSPLSYEWDFGDGSTGSGRSPRHTYDEPGQYVVQLTASNDVGEDSRTVNVQVNRSLPEICTTVSEMNASFFGRNSSTLTDEAEETLQENSDILSRCPNLTVQVEGFAAPGERNQQSLSEDRAQAVASFYEDSGVESGRIQASGQGQVEGVTSKKGGTRQYRRVDSIPQRDM